MRILFISHDASRTGAPMIVLHLLRWFIQEHPQIKIDALLIKGGDLEEDFRSVVRETYVLKSKSKNLLFHRAKIKILSYVGFTSKTRETKLLELIAVKGYDLIYANSVVSIPVAHHLKELSPSTKLILHAHELRTVIKQEIPDFKTFLPHVDKIIAASQMVKDSLVIDWGAEESKIKVVYEFSKNTNDILEKSAFHVADAFTIGASGGLNWRKGYDIFIQVARYIMNNYQPKDMQFVWVGGQNNFIQTIIDGDIEKSGLTERVKFIGQVENPFPIYNSFDIFILPSREDPFPLVCIEAAQLEKPIICFEKATGIAEVLKHGGGHIVPYLNIESMATKIMHYYNNRDEKTRDGQVAKELFSKYTPEVMCPIIYEEIENLIG